MGRDIPHTIVVRTSEVLPTDGKGSRLWRSGLFTKILSNEGRRVDWVFSSFDHYNKKTRMRSELFNHDFGLPNVSLVMLKTPGYRKNVSVSRFIDHFIFSLKLGICLFRRRKSFDNIVVSYPTPDSAFVAVMMAKFLRKKVCVDIRDLWPDCFYSDGSMFSRGVRRLLFSPYRLMAKFTFKFASTVVAANEQYLLWSYSLGRKVNQQDSVIYIPFERPMVSKSASAYANELISKFHERVDIVITFGGSLSPAFDFSSVKNALSGLSNNELSRIGFVIIGDGECSDALKHMFKDNENILFTGRISSEKLFAVLKASNVAIAPYKRVMNFEGHIPNKIAEYSAAGTPIITSLNGAAVSMLDRYDCGFSYNSHDDLTKILRGILDKNVLNTKRAGSLKLYEENFSVEVAADKFLKALD